jgi:hypothetical protein
MKHASEKQKAKKLNPDATEMGHNGEGHHEVP